MSLTITALLAATPFSPRAAEPEIGRKLDNYLNHNLPFLQWEESYDYSEYSDFDPYTRYLMIRHTAQISIGVEYYNEMDAEEKAKVDANNQLETALGWLGGAATNMLWGAKAASIGRTAAEKIGANAFGAWWSGALANASTSYPGEIVGSY
jgi:hypothetical protein